MYLAQGGVLPHIQTELLPKKTKGGDDEHAGTMESQRGGHGNPMMIHSGSASSMPSSGNKNKSMPPSKKSIGAPMPQKKSGKPKPMQPTAQQKSSQQHSTGQKHNQKPSHHDNESDDDGDDVSNVFYILIKIL